MSGFKLGWKATLLLTTFFLAASPAFALPLKIEKGPILHFFNGKISVNIQAEKLKQPVLQWSRGGTQKEFPMEKVRRSFWRGSLLDADGEYRIVEGDQSTPWIPILNQKISEDKFVFALYGENLTGLGHPVIHKIILEDISKENPSLILHTGNLVNEGNRRGVWKQYFEQTKGLFGSIPFQPAIGPRDGSKTERYADYYDVSKKHLTYYAYQYGGAYFIAMDSTRSFGPRSKQYKFLKETLEKIKGQAPTIVYFHHPPFSMGIRGSNQRIQKFLVPLFEKYGVDLVLSGHERAYERIGPINGVTYIVTGGGGAVLTDIEPHPDLANYKTLYHYLVFEVDGEKIRGEMKDLRRVVEDQFEIQHLANPIPPDQYRELPKMKLPLRTIL